MIKKVTELILLLGSIQRKKFFMIQLLAIITAGFELITVASIGPFMLVVTDPGILYSENILANVYEWSGSEGTSEFVLFLGVIVISILAIGTMISTYTIWVLSLFGQELGVSIQNTLFNYYLNKNWLFHSKENSANLIKQITAETNRVKSGIINPLIMLNARIFTAIFIITSMVIYDPYVAIIALLIFGIAYLSIYQMIRSRLSKNSKDVSNSHTERYKELSEGLGGIRDVLFLRIQEKYMKRFKRSGRVFARGQGSIVALSQIPRYFMELIAFSSIIIFILYLMGSHDRSLSAVVPVLSVYALAGVKLLPAFQQVYASISTIQGNLSAFDSIREDFKNSQNEELLIEKENESNFDQFKIGQKIELRDISFSYPGKLNSALNNLNIEIPVNKTVGIVGSSGSGKSTIIDIILGLITPDSGEIVIDGEFIIHKNNISLMQEKIGFVPQSIFLSDASIKENIAFGKSINEINKSRIQNSVMLANLDEFISTLPDGLNTQVGQNGMQLSGGQRQRIGIARALYRESEILIFDEATSSLDNVTEALVMDAINNFGKTKTIIIVAHRLSTVQKCDKLYLVDNGHVVDSGNYEYLLQNNKEFLEMATIIN
jgi:HlyD family secretion protein